MGVGTETHRRIREHGTLLFKNVMSFPSATGTKLNMFSGGERKQRAIILWCGVSCAVESMDGV